VVQRDGIRYAAYGFASPSQWSPTVLSVKIDSILVQDKEPTAADLDGAVVILSAPAANT
jgi:hypothetical protein